MDTCKKYKFFVYTVLYIIVRQFKKQGKYLEKLDLIMFGPVSVNILKFPSLGWRFFYIGCHEFFTITLFFEYTINILLGTRNKDP